MKPRPEREGLGASLALAALFALVFALLYGGASLWTERRGTRLALELPLDGAIPFVPWTAALYLSLVPLMLAAPFVFRGWERLLPLFSALVFETAVAALVFVTFPISHGPQSVAPAGFAGGLHRLADTLNLAHNSFPSLHVAFACTVSAAYCARVRGLRALFLSLWGAGVVASTLFAHQHRTLDVLAGMALAAAGLGLVLPRAASPGFTDALRLEFACLDEFRRFAARHPRYLAIFACLYGASLFGWRRARVARAGFCFLQLVDDLLDGDRVCAEDPERLVRDVQAQFASGHFEPTRFELSRLGRLAAATRTELAALSSPHDDPRALVTDLIEVMLHDRARRLARRAPSGAELAELRRGTFAPSLDLLLLAARSPLRARDVPELVEALGWCSTVRDLEEDLAAGRIDVPAEVLAAAGLSTSASLAELARDPFVGRWLVAEHAAVLGQLARTRARLAGRRVRGVRLLLVFVRSIERHARRLPRRFPAAFRADPAQAQLTTEPP
jgi:hypothetical protein